MLQNPILYILLASAISFALAYFMYHRTYKKNKLRWFLGFLRFISVWVLLLLLFNPKIKKTTYESVKTGLPILLDNSRSIHYLNQEEKIKEAYALLKEHKELQQHFDVSFFRFGSDIQLLDSLDFLDRETQITAALETLQQIYKDTDSPILLFTDGNQTSGRDYTYYASQMDRKVYPIVMGDTTQYPDLRIDKVTVNRYSYLHNDFPVEIHTSLQNQYEAKTELRILHKNQIVHKQNLEFKKGNSSQFVNITLPANYLGVQTYEVLLSSLENEKNIENNQQSFAIDVLDSNGKIALVTQITHPDIGTLKRSLEQNSFLEIQQLSVEEAKGKLAGFNLVILYEPDQNFEPLLLEIEEQELHALYFTGTFADWNTLITHQNLIHKPLSKHSDLVQGKLDANFDLFLFEPIDFEQLPPLETQFGKLEIHQPHITLLQQYISGVETGNPLLTIYEAGSSKRAIWDARGIWRWRSALYEKEKDHTKFDDFLQALFQYLSSTQHKEQLQVYYENFYYESTNSKLKAQYFDTNFKLDRQASLEIKIVQEDTVLLQSPLLPSGLYQEIGIEELKAGSYQFEIVESNSKEKFSGRFEILPYEVEQKFTRAHLENLEKLAKSTEAKIFYPNEIERLIEELLQNKKYQIKERKLVKEVALIDYTYLLIVLIASLGLEWFMRKYNGML